MRNIWTKAMGWVLVLGCAAFCTSCVKKEPVQNMLVIDAQRMSSASLIYSAEVADNSVMKEIVDAFGKEIGERLQLEFTLKTDETAESGETFEILVGWTSRELSQSLNRRLDTMEKSSFGIAVSENQIAVSGTEMYLVYRGLDYLLTNCVTHEQDGGAQLKVEKDWIYIETPEQAYPDPAEVIASGKEYAFYVLEELTGIPTEGNYKSLQGGGTDGAYAYYAMIDSKSTPQSAVIYKYDLATWELVAKSEPMPSGHTNDITYDSKNNRLVISFCSEEDGYLGLSFVNPHTLEFIEYKKGRTPNHGVEYLPERNQYVFTTAYSYHITNDSFTSLAKFPCGLQTLTRQGICCDSTYIYDVRYEKDAETQTIEIMTLKGSVVGSVAVYYAEGEPENIFRDGNSFVLGCNKTDNVHRLALLYKNWW